MSPIGTRWSGHVVRAMTLIALLAGVLSVGGAASPPAVADNGGHNLQARAVFAKRVAVPGGRKLYLECRGTGSPTVILEAGAGNNGRVWSLPTTGGGRPVFPAVARFTRVCVYDRPGTIVPPDRRSRSQPVAMPRSARDIVLDLRALLKAADVPGPYVLVGHSFGGMVVRLYATTYPRQVAGLVSIDAQHEDFITAFKELLTTEQYDKAILNPDLPPGLQERLDIEVSGAQMRQAQADTPLRRMPFVVLSHSRDLPNPFGFPPDWPSDALERAFRNAQDELATLVPGTRHVIAAKSGHYIQLDQPALVVRAIRETVKQSRKPGS